MAGSVYSSMKRAILLLVVMVGFASVAVGQIKYKTYTNDRFFFSIEYPISLLKMQPPPENRDGRTFLSSDNSVEVRVWGQYNAESLTLREKYDLALKGFDGKPTYMVLGKSSFVISGIKDEKIVYLKTLYRKDKDADVYYTFTIEYPVSKRKEYDPVVTHIANSFKIIPSADI
jgi:hypothetical protein